MGGIRKVQTGKGVRRQCACVLLTAALCMQGGLSAQAAAAQPGEIRSAKARMSVSGAADAANIFAGEAEGASVLSGDGSHASVGAAPFADIPADGSHAAGALDLSGQGGEAASSANMPAKGKGAAETGGAPARGQMEAGDADAPKEAGAANTPAEDKEAGDANAPAGSKEAGDANGSADGKEAGADNLSEEGKEAGSSAQGSQEAEGGKGTGESQLSSQESQTTGSAAMPEESNSEEEKKARGKVKKMSLGKKKLTIKLGKSKRLTGKINPAQAEEKVSWSSSNKKVARVKNGKVTSVSVGKATITAKVGGKKASCKVRVTLDKDAKKAIRAYQSYLGQKWIKWPGAYKSQYQEEGFYRQDKFKFSLADMNADGVPELVLANTGSPAHYEGYEAVYSYCEGEVQELVRNDKVKCYYPKTGYVVAQYFGMGYHSFYYRILKDGTTKQIGSEDTQVSGSSQTDYWFWDKKEVSRAEFYRLVRKDAGTEPIMLESSDYHKNTAANRKNMAKLYRLAK